MAGDIISGGYMANKLGEWMMPRGLKWRASNIYESNC